MKYWLVFLLLMGGATVAQGAEENGTIVVQGEGTAQYVPDRATVSLAISHRHPDLGKAQAQAAKVAASVLKLSAKLGIKERYVDTTAATVQPHYRWNKQREEQELVGYIVERTMRVELRDLNKLGDLVEGAVQAGVNQVSPPQLYSSKERALYRTALERAAQDARANAQTLAQALGAKLGAVVSISTVSEGSPTVPMPRGRMMAMAEADAGATYNAGERAHEAQVRVVFSLQ